MPARRTICVFSGKRGGFGAYLPLMRLLEAHPSFKLQILLGDMHASKEFGETVREARKYFPRTTLEIIRMGAGRGGTSLIRSENLGTCLVKAARALERLRPDLVMVHADRGEHLMVAYAALNLGIPVSHTQGGEISGNIDEVQRHAITKLAHLHFPETERAAERIRRMGEEPWRIHMVGSLYIDRIAGKTYPDPHIVLPRYGLQENEDYIITLFHPDTFKTARENYRDAREVFTAVRKCGLRSIVSYPCSDPGYEGVLAALREASRDPQFLVHKNIDNLDFLSLLSSARALVGNSSSAFVEAPYFHVPAINIGKRQIGRDREENVIDVKPAEKGVLQKIHFALGNRAFRRKLSRCGYRLGDGRAGERIMKVLQAVKTDERLFRKMLVT